MRFFSVRHQRDLFKRLGLNPDDYNPNNPDTVSRFARAALEAQLSGRDARGEPLTMSDMELLSTLTNRG